MHFCKGRLLLTKMAEKCGISREGSVGGQNNSKKLALNNRRSFVNLVCLLLLLTTKRNITVPCPVRSCHPLLQDSFLFALCLKKHVSQYAALNCLLSNPLHCLVVFKYGTPPTEVVYAHQPSIFVLLKARVKHIFPLFPPFCFKKSKQAVTHDKNRKRAELQVKIINLLFL